MEEEDGEGHDADLGEDDQAAPDGQPPHTGIPERVDEVPEGFALFRRRLAQPDRTGDRGRQARPREHQQPGLRPTCVRDRRERQGRGGSSERQGGLPDAECEPPLRRVEPAHDRTPARRVHAGAGAAREHERHDQHGVVGGIGGDHERAGGQCEARGENAALAEPVGEEPPGQEGHDRADADRGEHDADRGQREPILVAELRRHHRDPEEDGRVARLRNRAQGEDRPAVAAHAARLSRARSCEPGQDADVGAARPPAGSAAAALLVPAREAVPAGLRPRHLAPAARARRLCLGLVGGEATGGLLGLGAHSHSIVAGGFDERSSATRFTAGTSLMIRPEIVSSRS